MIPLPIVPPFVANLQESAQLKIRGSILLRILPAARCRSTAAAALRLRGFGCFNLVVEHFGNVYRSAMLRLATEQPVDVRHATDIAERDDVGFAFGNIGGFALPHGGADVGILDRKEPAKAAAIFAAVELDHFGIFDILQQLARLLVDLQLAQEMAAGVISDLALELRADIAQIEHID